MGRVSMEEHNGHKIVVVNLRDCSPSEIVDTIEEVMEIVTSQPPNSVHTLSDLSGAQFDRESIQRLKEAAAFDRPHIVRAAFYGADSLPDVYHKAIENFSARRFAIFKTREEALAYLTQEESNRQSA